MGEAIIFVAFFACIAVLMFLIIGLPMILHYKAYVATIKNKKEKQ